MPWLILQQVSSSIDVELIPIDVISAVRRLEIWTDSLCRTALEFHAWNHASWVFNAERFQNPHPNIFKNPWMFNVRDAPGLVIWNQTISNHGNSPETHRLSAWHGYQMFHSNYLRYLEILENFTASVLSCWSLRQSYKKNRHLPICHISAGCWEMVFRKPWILPSKGTSPGAASGGHWTVAFGLPQVSWLLHMSSL